LFEKLLLVGWVRFLEIIKGLHRIDEASANMAHANVYLVIDGKQLTVVDTGTANNAQKIVKYVQELGFQPHDVKTIVLTHYHMDHMGSAKELKELTGAKLAVHTEDADYVSGKTPLPKPKNILIRAVTSLVKPAPVEVDVRLKDGDRVGKLLVIYIPGHTPGSICLLDEEEKTLFAGDTIRFENERVSTGPESFSFDPVKVREAVRRISALSFEILLPGHGEVLRPEASDRVRRFAESFMKK
jgi:glyoxylase-like metal-dependent hydrolase (beta-lactamase superfamily II)